MISHCFLPSRGAARIPGAPATFLAASASTTQGQATFLSRFALLPCFVLRFRLRGLIVPPTLNGLKLNFSMELTSCMLRLHFLRMTRATKTLNHWGNERRTTRFPMKMTVLIQ